MEGVDDRDPGHEKKRGRHGAATKHSTKPGQDEDGKWGTPEPPEGGGDCVIESVRKAVTQFSVPGHEHASERVDGTPRIDLQIARERQIAAGDETGSSRKHDGPEDDGHGRGGASTVPERH